MCEHCRSGKWTPHTQVLATPPHPGPYNHNIKVDVGIHDLLQALWAAGMETQFSCQGGAPNHTAAYILFNTYEDAIKFFAVTAERASDKGFTPKMKLEMAIGLAPDYGHTSAEYPPRGTVRWPASDTEGVKSAWL